MDPKDNIIFEPIEFYGKIVEFVPEDFRASFLVRERGTGFTHHITVNDVEGIKEDQNPNYYIVVCNANITFINSGILQDRLVSLEIRCRMPYDESLLLSSEKCLGAQVYVYPYHKR